MKDSSIDKKIKEITYHDHVWNVKSNLILINKNLVTFYYHWKRHNTKVKC